MEQWELNLYERLTNEHDESGETAELNYQLFGNNEWSGIARAEALEKMKDKMEIESWGYNG